MGGLQRIAKRHGGIVINGTKWVWDYEADAPVEEADMPFGSERWKRSQRALYTIRNSPPLPPASTSTKGSTHD